MNVKYIADDVNGFLIDWKLMMFVSKFSSFGKKKKKKKHFRKSFHCVQSILKRFFDWFNWALMCINILDMIFWIIFDWIDLTVFRIFCLFWKYVFQIHMLLIVYIQLFCTLYNIENSTWDFFPKYVLFFFIFVCLKNMKDIFQIEHFHFIYIGYVMPIQFNPV